MKRKILLRVFALVAATMCAMGMQAAALAYACYTSSDRTLTFYYDDSSHSGTRFSLNTGTATPGWSNFASSIQKVVFDPSFAGASPTSTFSWFAGMSNLTTIDGITYLNTSEVTNMASMFSNCSSLTSLNVTNFYTVNVTNMSWMFEGCSGLTHLNVSSFSTSKVTRMTKMFYGCSGLTSLSLRGFNTSQVTDMSYMFYGCSGLTSLDLITITTDNVTNMKGMFGNCSGLTGLNSFSGVNTSQVTDMSSMFINCTNLRTLDLRDFNTANVTDMSRMFMGCEGLTSLNLSSFNTSNVTNMSYMFDNCYALTTLDLSHFNTSNVTDMKYMFAVSSSGVYTNNLTTITVGESWSTAAVTSSDNMFWKCTNLVGGMGTTYSSSHINKEYAHIDGGTSNPGYLTDGCEAYACYTSSNTTLTFYYDTRRASYPAAVTYSMNSGTYIPGWHSIASSITRVVFDSSFANARPESTCRWFSGMTNLQSITGMQYLNTSNVTNMYYMFDDCSGLTSISLSGFNTSNVTIMTGMFSGCSGLTALNLSGFNTGNVISMAYMFDGCSRLSTLNLSAFNTANVTSMRNMFYGCNRLTSLNLSGFNTGNVTSMESMFYDCSGLTSLNVSGFNTANVTEMGHMFDYCIGLTTLDLSSFNTAKVTDMRFMFADCSGLTSLDLTNFNTAKVADMRYMFYRCSNLATIYVGSGWSTYIVTSSDNMFDDCTSLVGSMGTTYDANHVDKTYAHIDGGPSNPGYLSERVPEAYACYTPSNTTLRFYYDTQRSTRTGTTYDLNTGNNSPVWYTDGTRGSVTRVVFDASFADARPTTAYNWFNGMTNLQTISGMSYLNTSQVTNMENMFYNCQSLQSLDVSGFNTASVTSMYFMFGGCGKLTSLDVSNFNTSNVTNMNGMFYGCSGLTSLNVSNFNTGNVTNMVSMFATCGLTSLDLSSFNTANVTNMDYMFHNSSSLTSLDLSSFNTTNVRGISFMFFNCSSLTSLDLSSFNTANVTDMKFMFYNCSSLTSLDLSSFNTANVAYMQCMFQVCSKLTTIYAGNDWSTAAVTISASMFLDCTSLVGGMGTTYDADHVNAAYAHIDGGLSNPGYLTDPNAPSEPEAYVCYMPENTTLTFYYDGQRSNRAGTTYDLNTGENNPGWYSDGTNSSVTSVEFDPSFADTRPTTAYAWFSGMSNLESITGLDYLNTTDVTKMNNMFRGCGKLTSLDLSSFNTSNVTSMYFMFYDCIGLTSLNVSGFNTANVTNMGYMFSGCSKLTSLDVSDFNTAGVTRMMYMFYGCSKLATIYAGDEWSTTAVTSSNYMFRGSTSLVGGMGTTFDADHVDAAYAHIDGGPSNPGYFTAEGAEPWTDPEAYACYTSSNTTLTFYYDPWRSTRSGTTYDLNTGQNNPGWYSDGTNSSVTSVEFDPSFAYARPTTACAWFSGMSNLESITGLDYLNTTDVTQMNNMFRGCGKLTSLDVSGFNTASVGSMYFMFYDCIGLTSLDVSGFNTSNVTNMGYMFSGCGKLTSLDVSSFNTAGVFQMTYMFYGCSKLATIYAGDEWSTTAVTNSNNMFRGCTSLVGGQGTTFDANHVDKTYAHIDGGPSNPGYFSEKADFVIGDVNGDGIVNITDATALIMALLNENFSNLIEANADMNGDGFINITDATVLIAQLLNN